MNTFNIGFVFGQGQGVCIIVCNSPKEIDKETVQIIASSHFRIASQTKKAPMEVMLAVVEGIRKDCGINAVLVNADVACMIPANTPNAPFAS